MIKAEELLAASKPLRRLTAAESRQALKALGIDEESQRQCVTCLHWKSLDEFSPAGIRNGRQSYDSYCKPCKRVRQTLWRMGK